MCICYRALLYFFITKVYVKTAFYSFIAIITFFLFLITRFYLGLRKDIDHLRVLLRIFPKWYASFLFLSLLKSYFYPHFSVMWYVILKIKVAFIHSFISLNIKSFPYQYQNIKDDTSPKIIFNVLLFILHYLNFPHLAYLLTWITNIVSATSGKSKNAWYIGSFI